MGNPIYRIPFALQTDIEKQCDTKQAYYSSTDAEAAALMARMRTGDPIYPYKCRIHDYYHIGHKY
jgi:hypothetical protein